MTTECVCCVDSRERTTDPVIECIDQITRLDLAYTLHKQQLRPAQPSPQGPLNL